MKSDDLASQIISQIIKPKKRILPIIAWVLISIVVSTTVAMISTAVANESTLGTFRTTNLTVDNSSSLGSATATTLNTSGAVLSSGTGTFSAVLSNAYVYAATDVYANVYSTYLGVSQIGFRYLVNGPATGYINAVGHAETTDQPRSLEIDDGQGSGAAHAILFTNGSNRQVNIGAGAQIISGNTPSSNFGSLSTASTDWSGDVTGIGAHTAIILTYSTPFPNRSRCTANPISISVTVETIMPVAVAGSVTFSCYSVAAAPILTNCDDFTYNCIGQ